MTRLNVNPSTLFGGTWERWGQGRVPVGVAAEGTFNTVEKTGGAETHPLTVAETPSHAHRYDFRRRPMQVTNNSGNTARTGSTHGTPAQSLIGLNSRGSGQGHNNLQPYITCYMWKRTA